MTESAATEGEIGATLKEGRAFAMFTAAFAHLVLLAALIPHGGVSTEVSQRVTGSSLLLVVFFGLWLAIIAEGVVGFLAAPDRGPRAARRLALVSLAPPFRMTISPWRPNDRVWLPRLGWIDTGKAALAEMEVRTALPMLVMTALIVPVIIADFAIGKNPHDLLAAQFEQVVRVETSDNVQRLFMLDETEAVLANVARPDRSAQQGIEGDWIVLGKPEGAERTTLSIGRDSDFTFRTACAVTEGRYSHAGGLLSFTDVTKTRRCPPTWLEIAIYAVTALIWFSFAFEFILMVSLAEKKLDFCKKHWINIVIILLPLLAFLRSLQIFRFLRMAKAGKLMRAYRLRGLLTRLVKLAVVFNLIERFLSRDPDRYSSHLSEKIAEKEEELAVLRAKLDEGKATESS